MGHERVGYLPKSKRWKTIVKEISEFSDANDNVAEISRRTTSNVRNRYKNIEADQGVQSAFEFLLLLSIIPKTANWQKYLVGKGIQLPENFSLIELTQSAKKFIEKNEQSKEYSSFAYQAVVDSISIWTTQNSKQSTLFFEPSEKPLEIWNRSTNGAGFCELARTFFSKFTERYLRYFLERETVLRITNIFDLTSFNDRLEKHVQDISQHAFETAKITQSFAAGWYNKNVQQELPPRNAIRGFLSTAFGKLNSEILREENK
jgi:hypothetical protein